MKVHTLNRPRLRIVFLLATIVMLGLAACGPSGADTTPPQEVPAEPTKAVAPPATEVPPTDVPPTAVPEPTAKPALPPLPPERQRIEFRPEDPKNLVGYYYPGAENPSPLVILMHWAGGDQRDWAEIAPWLQNRAAEMTASAAWQDVSVGLNNPGIPYWLLSDTFPHNPFSVAVFTFDFRDFGESDPGLNHPFEWGLDARGAIQRALELEGIDPHRVIVIGASIGADGAVIACHWGNVLSQACLGAMSLSPGSYLGESYADVVIDLMTDTAVVVCMYGEEDHVSRDTCNSPELVRAGEGSVAQARQGLRARSVRSMARQLPEGADYRLQGYEGDWHGMMLINPSFDPVVLEEMISFIDELFFAE